MTWPVALGMPLLLLAFLLGLAAIVYAERHRDGD
jgi:hypothetical protein